MRHHIILTVGLLTAGLVFGHAGEKSITELRDFSQKEMKQAGFDLRQAATLHIKARGAGGSYGWSYKSDRMFAYGWIINADTRALVWEMTTANSAKTGEEREFDGTITLEPGSYEVYFAAATFTYHSALTHINVNVDHRSQPLFGSSKTTGRHFFSWLTDWWMDDITDAWKRRSTSWGIELLVDEVVAGGLSTFTPPKISPAVVLKATGLGDNETVRRAFTLSAPTVLTIYALGEGQPGAECADCSWIVNARTRERVWDPGWRDGKPAGGAPKNLMVESDVRLNNGTYVLYAITDGSHSAADWNDAPPYDPLSWGVTISVNEERDRKNISPVQYREDQNIIVSMTKVRDNESRSEGFTLKEDTKVRVYAFGERSNSRRTMADYGAIIDAKTRQRVWTMDVDRTRHAGGASKNRFIDEVVSLPKGSYVVTYVTDDSHAYDDWNDDPPFDPEHYGITVSGAEDTFSSAQVTTYVEEKDKNVIAQIIRVGVDADRSERFTLERTTRIRVYAIGEGQNREMFDYGWIEDARTGTVVWEMTYGMTFHAGGGRKNRMVNTNVVLDKGEYLLRYRTDDSHAWGDWNVDPPDDRDYWGITLYRESGPESPLPQAAPSVSGPPATPKAQQPPR
jgi:hypothetical protein